MCASDIIVKCPIVLIYLDLMNKYFRYLHTYRGHDAPYPYNQICLFQDYSACILCWLYELNSNTVTPLAILNAWGSQSYFE